MGNTHSQGATDGETLSEGGGCNMMELHVNGITKASQRTSSVLQKSVS